MWLPLRAEGRRVWPTRHESLAWEAVVPPAAVAALRYPARPRSVVIRPALSRSAASSPRRPPGLDLDAPPVDRAGPWRRTTPTQDLVGKVRPARRGLRSFDDHRTAGARRPRRGRERRDPPVPRRHSG